MLEKTLQGKDVLLNETHHLLAKKTESCLGCYMKEQLVVLCNMERINALLIRQDLPQNERLIELNKVAITQMKSLLESNSMKKLK